MNTGRFPVRLGSTQEFLTALFGHDLLDGYWVGIASKTEKALNTLFFSLPGVEEAARQATKLSKRRDVYTNVGVFRKEPKKRGKEEEVSGIVGLWADVDIAHPAHGSRKKYAPDRETARRILEETGLSPSLVIDSGHGLQAWWLFREPLLFDSQQEREAAKALAKGWVGTVEAGARSLGPYHVDRVGDLARMLRIPGTLNHKHEPVPVRVLEPADGEAFASIPRYNPGDFEAHLVDLPPDSLPAPPHNAHGTTPPTRRVSPSGRKRTGPPHGQATSGSDNAPASTDERRAKLARLLNSHPTFRERWAGDTTGLHDTSSSGLDQSLVSIARRDAWPYDELVWLIAEARKHRGDSSKKHSDMDDYCKRTIQKARDTMWPDAGPTGHHTRIDDAFFDDEVRKLKNASAALIYMQLERMADCTGTAFPSQDYLAATSGLSRRTVSEAVRRLVEHGCIETIKKKSPGNRFPYTVYRLLRPWRLRVSAPVEEVGPCEDSAH